MVFSRRVGAAVCAVAMSCGLVATPNAGAAPPLAERCHTPRSADGDEPRCNPALAQSPWPGAHRNSYAQASSPFPGPEPGEPVTYRHMDFTSVTERGAPIVLSFSDPYDDGERVAWGSVVSAPENQGAFKLDPETGEVIDFLSRPTGRPSSGPSGAYNVLDRDNHLIVARNRAIEVYGDAVPGERLSGIRLLRSFALPEWALCGEEDRLVGITMLYDGMVAYATERGIVGVVPRQPSRMTPDAVRAHSLSGAACDEEVSNSIAADEDGGIYVVTSEAQYRVNWDGQRLRTAWRAEYATGGTGGGSRLGAGSGSTPSLMGTGQSDDRFVVITDSQDPMHLVLLWRDEIPARWEPIARGKDRRIACEIPVTFGDEDARRSASEQSVLVRGYASVVVSNGHTLDPVFGALPAAARPFTVLADQVPGNEPRGVQRIDWNPKTRTCHTEWANPTISIPNGIPTMSAKTGLVYGIGRLDGSWGLRGVDFATGEGALWVPASPLPADNSFYAATEIGPGGSVWTGTAQGVTSFVPTPD